MKRIFAAMMKCVLLVMLICGGSPSQKSSGDSLLLMFWNLENFFDWKDDSLSVSASDAEFSSYGSRHWTKRKFLAKCNAIAKSILWISDSYGRFPDIVGVAEAENRFVLERLLRETALRKKDYAVIHFDSPDPRGIDVALLYRKSRIEMLDAMPLHVANPDRDGPPLITRDILLSTFLLPSGDSLAVLVNHHPSKYGGGSGWRRQIALQRMKEATDSLSAAGFMNIVAMGDFNDTPDNTVAQGLVNLALPLARKGEGTIRYSGIWELIDMFFVSPGMLPLRQEIVRVPFLMTRDGTHSGEKPLRTYSGPRYIGGVSDHCPILLEIPLR